MKSLRYSAILILLYTTSSYGGNLTLVDALSKTSANNRTLKLAKYDERIAEEGIRLNRSGYFPRVDLQGGYTFQQAPQSVKTPYATFKTQDSDFAFTNMSATQTLYDFGRTGARYAKAKAVSDATSLSYKSQQQEVFLRAVISYFRILQSQKLLQSADEEVIQMEDHLRVAKNLFDQGVVTRNDLLQAEVRLSSSRQRRLETANLLDNSWLVLNDLMGESPDYRSTLVEGAQLEPPPSEIQAKDAIEKRSELQAQKKLLVASQLEAKEAKTGYYPEIFTKLGLDYVENSMVREQVILSATVGLKVNLFDGLATTARYRQAVENRSKTEERLHQMEEDLALEYRTALNDARVAKERIAATETSIKSGEENLRINKDRYQEQVGTATDVIDAQTLLTQIRTENYQAIFDYEVALARVKRARGEL
jgi:outer membrane protein TolC